MRRIAERDVACFESLYDRYHAFVCSIAMRILDDEASAEEVTHRVFTAIWSDPRQFRGGNFIGWIARLVRGSAIDVMRSRRLHPESQLPDDPELRSFPVDDMF